MCIRDRADATEDVPGLVNGHQAKASYILQGTNVGDYTGKFNPDENGKNVTIKTAEGKDVTENYEITIKPGTLKIVKPEKENLTATVEIDDWEYNKTFDPGNTLKSGASSDKETSPEYTYYVQTDKGWIKVNGEPVDAGSYAVVATWKETRNYPELHAHDTFMISPKPIEIIVDSKTKRFEEDDPTFTGNISGNIAGDDIGTITYIRTNDTEKVGTYEGILSAEVTNPSNNYQYTVVPADFTIIKANSDIVVRAEGATKFYDGKGISINAAVGRSESTLLYSTDIANEKVWTQDKPDVYKRQELRSSAAKKAVAATAVS